MTPKILVIYHKACFDGFGAAFSAWLKFKDEAIYVPCQYGEIPEIKDSIEEIYILDFSFSKEILLEMKSKVKKIVVLDHHKTAQEALKDLDFAYFDMKKSGAMLAWEYFHPKTEAPWLIKYIEDRDLWLFNYPETEGINAVLYSYKMDFNVWLDLMNRKEELLKEAEITLRINNQQIESICKHVQMVYIDNVEIPAVNSSILVSEVGEFLNKKYPDSPFVAIYKDIIGKRIWSLRSKDKADVAKIAEKYGGGGHKNASGFSQPLDSNDLIKKKP